MECFIFSGLGADHRVFELIDFGEFNPKFIPWKSTSSDETLASYAAKMSESFPPQAPFLLIGISFGGILAQEVAKLYPNARLLLIASIQNPKQMPLFMRIGGKLYIEKLIPVRMLLRQKRINCYFFGAKDPNEQERLLQILETSEPKFTRFAIGALMRWKGNKHVIKNCLHIHGDHDKIFPITKVHPNFTVPNGTHFMTVSQPTLLSQIIQTCLYTLKQAD